MKNLVIDIEKHFPSAYKIFSPADYYSPFIPLDQMECLQVITDADYCKETYSINPVLEWDDLDSDYDNVIFIWPVHTFNDRLFTSNFEERRNFFSNIYEKLKSKKIKKYIYIDGSDRAIIKRGLDWLDSMNYRCDLVFKREFRRNYEYDYDLKRVFPFPFSVFGKPNPSWLLYENRISSKKERQNDCFWAGSPIFRNDEYEDQFCDRAGILNKINNHLSTKRALDHNKFLNEISEHKFFLHLNGTGHLCKRFFEGLSVGSLMMLQSTDLVFPFDDGDFFLDETIFNSPEDFIQKLNILKNDENLYNKCLKNQNFIIDKYFNYDWIKKYIFEKIKRQTIVTGSCEFK